MNFGQIIDRLQYFVDDDSAETLVDIKQIINAKYIGIASEHPWQSLMSYVNGQGTVLPSDLQYVIYVEDNTDYLYFRRGIPQRYFSPTLYNYFMNMSQTDPIVEVNDGVVTENSKTVTSATASFVAATHEGEFVRLGENTGRYEIDSVDSATQITLTQAFRGASDTTVHLEVRPRGTKKIAFTDEDGDEISSSTIKMWYLQKPLPLYNDYDEVLLPGNCEALVIAVLQDMNIAGKYDNDALKLDAKYLAELDKMKALEPVPDRFVLPRGADGRPFIFGRRGVTGEAVSIHYRDMPQ